MGKMRSEKSGHPAGFESRYHTEPPNRDVRLYTGPFVLFQYRQTLRLRGRLSLTWFPTHGVRFRGTTGSNETKVLDLAHRTILEVGSLQLRAPVILTSSHGLQPSNMNYEGIINGTGLAGTPASATAIYFHLVNFHSFVGDPIQFGTLHTRGRLVLRAHGWRLTIDQQPRDRELQEELRTKGGYAITHAATLTRANGRAISRQTAEDHLGALHYLLAFCRGCWCGPILTTAFAAGTEVWAVWASWKLTPWRSIQSWFPTSVPKDTAHLYSAFRRKWNTPLWKHTLSTVIHWYVQANAYSDTLEASIVPAFAALEALAWVYIVEDRQLVPPQIFDRKTRAWQRTTRLFDELKIPTAIPAEHHNLRRAATRGNTKSGPEMIAVVRNALVHPRRRGLLTGNVLLQTKSLSLEYVELATLAILQYNGSYTRRLTAVTRSEATVRVPWA